MVDYRELERALHHMGVTQGAAEFHGTVCGRLCAAPEGEVSTEAGQGAGDANTGNDHELMQQVRDEALDGLIDAELGFNPLLPDDEQRLSLRVEALAQWCSGFVYGLASVEDVDLEELSAEVQEVVRDLTQISRAGLSPDADVETDEQAYAEIVEYVRIGAQLIFMEIAGVRGSGGTPSGETLH